jgi:hypothetical protein
MSPSILVIIRLVNPDPAAFVEVVTILPATNTSEALVVVKVPEELDVPFPLAATATSKGLNGSKPLYSRMRISGKAVDPLNVTLTVFDPAAIFLA